MQTDVISLSFFSEKWLQTTVRDLDSVVKLDMRPFEVIGLDFRISRPGLGTELSQGSSSQGNLFPSHEDRDAPKVVGAYAQEAPTPHDGGPLTSPY